ncbi:hypothetical protein BSY18_449 [Blastomonas sp. RAC04]|uniref:glycine-rich domain-containing protein n=1 Tax=Blastomonas sp. RAC04 TaxID=1842535 RepID=UPI00083DFA2B|nr:hypothetical protein [Blastomonas sp. RAC04]AOG00590.1 hypothetical protein BSY18_449 [Blastomonas sp. RAC04]
MGTIDDSIWRALDAMRIEPAGASLTFTKRLARENGWSRRHAAAVVEEYKRFLYLAATGTSPVTPSDQVDQAWHLHLAYTHHYWGELCARIIGRPLHHGPTAGGGAEGRKYRSHYAQTLARYRDTFGAEPPAEIWPAAELRFGTRYQWVDRSRNFVLPRRSVSVAALAGGAALLAACTALAADTAVVQGSPVFRSFFNGVQRSDLGFFGLVLLIFIGIAVMASIIRRLRARRGAPQQDALRRRNARRGSTDSSDGSGAIFDIWSGGGAGPGAAAAGGAAFMAGGGDFGGSGADGDWDGGADSDSGSDSGGDSGCSGCGGGCGGGD